MKSCVVIGGGVIGLSTAYYLAKAGHSVKVIDQSDMTDGCSYGNAGMIVPSHIIPLAQPGMIKKGVRWMFNSKSPFYVKPRLNKQLLRWGRDFYRHANEKHVNGSKTALLELSLLSKRLFKDLNELDSCFDYQEKGLLMLFQSDKVKCEELEAAQMVQELGLDVNILSSAQVENLDGACKTEAQGAVHYLSDAHLNPRAFMTFLKKQVLELGVELIPNTALVDFELSNGAIVSAKSKTGKYEADEFVLCAGAWSSSLSKKLGFELNLLAGKGYSFNVTLTEKTPKYPSILCEGKVAITPMKDYLRIAGTMEITSVDDTSINMSRVKGIVDTVNRFYPDLGVDYPSKESVWFGFRPCTSTGLPIISKSKQLKNLTINSGHAMMGLSLAPASGFLVNQLISGEEPEVDLGRFSF